MPKFKEPEIQWKNSKARQLVLQYLREDKIPLDAKQLNDEGKRMTGAMIFEAVCSMDGGENAKYDPKQFPKRLGALRKKIREETVETFKEPDIKWQDSQAKKNLTKYPRDGLIPLDPKAVDPDGNHITPAIVYKMVKEDLKDEEIGKYDKKKFDSKFQHTKAAQKKTRNTTKNTSDSIQLQLIMLTMVMLTGRAQPHKDSC